MAARLIKAGEIVLSEEPILIYPQAETCDHFCSFCFKALLKSSRRSMHVACVLISFFSGFSSGPTFVRRYATRGGVPGEQR